MDDLLFRVYTSPMSSTTPLQKLDAEHHLHPFTNHDEMHAIGTHVLTDGEGVWLHDAEGRRLLDGLAGLWCVNVGYGRRELIDAASRQMERLCYYPSFFNSTTEPAIRLAARLSDLAPGRLHHAMFSNSGSEANETALKLIRAYWKLKGQPKRTKIVTREFAYHGVTLATTSMTGLPSCQTPFELPLPGYIQVPGPHAYAANRESDRDAYGQWCIEETERIIEREGPETIGAIFAEPVQGAGGVIVPPPGYLGKLRALARKYGILFVADEVITAFGRLGAWFASDIWDLDPDFMCLAKGLTSGYLPLGATMVADDIGEVLTHAGYLAHGFTYSGHPVSCAVALANIDLIESDQLIPRVRDNVGPYFQKKLQSFAGHPAVGEVRGCELIGAIDLLPQGGKSALSPTSFLGVKAAKLAREEGVIVRGIRDLIAIAPPLTATHEEIDFIFTAVGHTLDRLWK
jgi:putrescine---pyruvate transaminase